MVDERLGDLALVRGDFTGAAARYRDALARSTTEAQTRGLQVKLVGADTPGLGPLLRDYFSPFTAAADKPTLAARQLYAALTLAAIPGQAPLGEYLVGLQLLHAEAPADAIVHLRRSLAPVEGEAPLPSVELARSARLHLVGALVRVRRYDEAVAILQELIAEPGIGNGHRMTYGEWLERIEFFRVALPTTGGMPVVPALEPASAATDDAGADHEDADDPPAPPPGADERPEGDRTDDSAAADPPRAITPPDDAITPPDDEPVTPPDEAE
ncbi:MAG: hypothetical protein R3B09_23015 [Nannocystaceae bacterium]